MVFNICFQFYAPKYFVLQHAFIEGAYDTLLCNIIYRATFCLNYFESECAPAYENSLCMILTHAIANQEMVDLWVYMNNPRKFEKLFQVV